MTTFRASLKPLLLAGVISLLGCSSPEPEEPLGFDACSEVECSAGLACNEQGLCRCAPGTCGEGRVCSDDGERCEEAPWSACAAGEIFDEAVGACRCIPEECGEGFACTADGRFCLPAGLDEECVESEPWDGESSLFEEVSELAGFKDLGVTAVRLSAVDLTGNGYPDLIARRSGLHSDDFEPGGQRAFWFLANQGDGTFQDITEESGILARRDGDSLKGRPAEVVAFGDINNNGVLDVVTAFSGVDGSEGAEVLLNDGTGRFTLAEASPELHQGGVSVARSGLSLVDVDGDGYLDLWVTEAGAQNRLFRGDGTGRFVEITEASGLTTSGSQLFEIVNNSRHHGHAWSGLACDLTGNGVPELLAANYGRSPNHLWVGKRLSAGEVSYVNHSVESGYAFDHRKDWQDNESARCFCKLNREAEDCADVPEPELIRCNSPSDVLRWNHDRDREPFRLGGNSGTTVCADLNNNGRFDLLTTEIVHWDVGSSSDPSEILYNTGEEPLRFERPGNEVTGLERPRDGVTFDDGDITAAVLDFDNDGRLDILIASTDYSGTRAHLYHQQADGRFERVDPEVGIDLTSAHGIAVGDFTGNGFIDVAIGHSRARCATGNHCLDETHVRLFKNNGAATNNFLQLQLEGKEGSNSSAIGARIEVSTPELLRVDTVDGGHGHYGMQHDLVRHFGLGASCAARVEITWPHRERSTEIFRLAAGARYLLRQGEWPEVVQK